MASAGQRALAALPLGASVNDKREALNRVYAIDTWKAQPNTAPYIPWATDEELKTMTPAVERRRAFERRLQENKREAFQGRLAFYAEHNLLKDDVLSWLDCPQGGQHALYLLLDQSPRVVFTVGNKLLYGVPEIVFYVDRVRNEDIPKAAALLNSLVDRMRRERGPESNKKNSGIPEEGEVREEVQPGHSAEALFGNEMLPGSSESLLHEATEEDLAGLGMMSWFHRNFLDSELDSAHVWVLSLPALAGEKKRKQGEDDGGGALMSAEDLYDAEGNVAYVQHGVVSVKPVLQLGPTLPPEMLHTMAGALGEQELDRLRKELLTNREHHEQMCSAWAFEHAPALLDGQALVDHLVREARRVQEEKDKGNLGAKPRAELSALVAVAVGNDRPAAVAQLAEVGASLAGDGVQRSFLMTAVQLGFEKVVEQLLRCHAPVDDKDQEGWTALSIAAQGQVHGDRKKAQDILDLLWEKGARLM